VRTIAVETLREWLEQGKPVTLLDIRPAEERSEFAIPGSVHVDAYAALKSNDPNALADVDLPNDRPVVTVCAAGSTSMIAAEQLRARGVEARSLAGGMKAWSLVWNTAEVALANKSAQVIQVRRIGKGCLSYLIGSHGLAAVIDPALDPELYLELADRHGWTITKVLDTHIHADHLSRSRKLAEFGGATLFLPDQKRVAFSFIPIRDGDTLDIGTVRLTAIRTPGHTPESTSYLLNNQALFTGDTLFVAGVGRPDLEASAEEAQTRARMLYRSLQRILTLPPETLILPAHTSELIRFDRLPIAVPLADVHGQVAILHASEEEFVEQILARIPPTPPNHQRIVDLNEAGVLPDGDPTDLEAGANRCAIT
jgi:glyoxylase-like metal-dependent hydrolase (beta-lactamase superfamily II)/rhodanese-related sulfurtransferase